MTIVKASNVGPSRIDVAYERLGEPTGAPVLLIMGLNAQLIGWPDGFCDELVQRGLHVIRFDNRDVGESTHFSGLPNFAAALAGDTSSAAYTLSDMAADTVGLLDVLGLDRAHLVGASMGGGVAQTVAIEYPQRVCSLTSIMWTTGTADKLCDVSGGRATAAAIPGAELVVIEGMGHDLPRALWSELAGRIAANVARG